MLDWIEAQRESLLETLVTWSGVNSGSYHLAGIGRMIDLVADYVVPLGAEVTRIDLPPNEVVLADGQVRSDPVAPLLKISKRPDAPFRVVLTGHLDTVFPVESAFQQAQLRDGDQLHGPGVADMKGGILVMLTALAAFERFGDVDRVGWTVLLNPDEEIGSLSSSGEMVAQAAGHDVALIYEPSIDETGLLAGARGGSGNFHCVVRGVSAHAGRAFDAGRNAVCAAADLALRLEALSHRRPGVTVNVAKIDGGGALNQVPDVAVVRFNVRLQAPSDQDWLTDQIAQAVAAVRGRPDISIDIFGRFTRPPKPMDENQLRIFELVRRVGANLGLTIRWQDTGGVCDGNNLAAAGLSTVDTLGVRGGLIHSDREFMVVSSLVERAQLSASLLVAFAEAGLKSL